MIAISGWSQLMTTITLYHGTAHTFSAFDYRCIGNGTDQEGPGIYLTTDISDAARYGRHIMVVEADFKKFVPHNGRISRRDIRYMIRHAPDVDYDLENYDENPTTALAKAVHAMVAYNETPNDAFQGVCADFYRYNPVEFVKTMTALGYDGVQIERCDGVIHYVAYNLENLRIVDAFKY